MRDPIDMVLSVSHDGMAVAAGPARAVAVAVALGALIPAGMVGYAEVGVRDGSARMVTPFGARSRVAGAAPEASSRHPVTLALRADPTWSAAVRLSDLVTPGEWRRHETYNALFRPLGFAHELVLPLPPRSADRFRAWTWNRTPARDFSDAEVTLASLLRPLLAAIPLDEEPSAHQEATDAVERARLTARESEVLGLLPSGMTAQQMGWVLRISPRTVHKHIEHLYEKLGVRDRSSAVVLALGRRADRE